MLSRSAGGLSAALFLLCAPVQAQQDEEHDPRFAPVTNEGPNGAADEDLPLVPIGRDASETPVREDPRFAPATGAGLGGATAEATDAITLRFSGNVTSELHYRLEEKRVGQFYDQRVLPQQLARNENTFNLKLQAASGKLFGVADVDVDWLGLSEGIDDLGSLSRPERVSPPRIQAHAVYLEATDVFIPRLGVRVGQQVVQWGVGDQFNPTNTVNPSDLENVLYFGRQISNLIARADYGITDSWTATALVVPVFKPAVLPASAELGMTATDRLPFVDDGLRWRLHADNAFGASLGYPSRVASIEPVLPEPTLDNAQWAVRIGGELLGQDVGLSYYDGRTDIPVPVANHLRQSPGEACDPNNSFDCIDGVVETDVTLRYPRVKVIGLNLAGEVDPFGWITEAIKPIGYRLEVGLYLPNERRFRITQDAIELPPGSGIGQPAGEYDYGLPSGERPLVVDSTPFAKWVFGLDYSFGRHVYANLMWVHGLPDEYGAGDFLHEGWSVRRGDTVRGRSAETAVDSCFLAKSGEKCARELLRPRIGDYLVIGIDLKLAGDRLLVRLFNIVDVSGMVEDQWDENADARVRTEHAFWSDGAHSLVIYPEIEYNVGDGFHLGGGALLQMGKPTSKFGDPAAGGSLAWLRASFAY
jgi:hypothetical protein